MNECIDVGCIGGWISNWWNDALAVDFIMSMDPTISSGDWNGHQRRNHTRLVHAH